jgi:hypothetical protein
MKEFAFARNSSGKFFIQAWAKYSQKGTVVDVFGDCYQASLISEN